MEIGRLCVKIAGRDAGNKCAVVDIVDKTYVLIDGNVRRRKCNIAHLEPLDKVIKIKKNASHADIASEFKKLKLDVWATKPKKSAEKPKKIRKTKLSSENEKGLQKSKTFGKEKSAEPSAKKEEKPAKKEKVTKEAKK